MMVIIAKSNKGLQILFLERHGPVSHSGDFGRVHTDLSVLDYHTKVLDQGFVEITFLRFEIEFIFAKDFQDLRNSALMILERFGEYKDVIEVNDNFTASYEVMKERVHHSLERRWRIC